MATQILPISATPGEKASFTLVEPTLLWVHQARGNRATVAINVKGNDGLFSELTEMVAGTASKSGELPAGEYEAVRVNGHCGFQRA